jgi:predicted dehydrogenase
MHDIIPSRRDALRQSALATAALALGVSGVQARAANETINIACIGTGGRCWHLMKSLVKIKNARVVSVCDVYDRHIAEAKKYADPKATGSKNYKEVLARKDVDAVLIASPDHWHVQMTIDAVEAGKDVYVEKPLTHSLEEGTRVLTAVKKSGKIVQVGTQQRSMPHIIKGKELVDSGRLGRIVKVHLTWNRNSDRVRKNKLGIDPRTVDWKAFLGSAPRQDFEEYRFRNWRWFWDFGGGLFTDLMVYWIDVAHWYLGAEHPLRAVSVGDHITSKGVWETPDTVQTVLQYPGPVQAYFEGTFSNARNAAMIEFMGTDATLYIDRGRYELHPERNRGKREELILGEGPRGKDFYQKPDGELLHLENWLECIRSRKSPTAPVSAGVSAAGAAHLANQAVRNGGVAEWKG